MRLDYALSTPESPQQSALVLAEELAKPFETCKLGVYYDPVAFDQWGRPAGFPTQGWGHLHIRRTKQQLMIAHGLDFSKRADHDAFDAILREQYPEWDQATADRWLRNDMRQADNSVARLFTVPLRDRQRAPLIDFAFNIGAGNLQASTLRRCILRGDMKEAAEQFLRWNKAGGVVLRGLTRRCNARRALFLS